MFDSHRVRKMQNFSQPPHNSHCTQRSLSEEMRARLPTTNKNAEEDGNIDVERNFNINGNDDDFDSSGAMKKKKSLLLLSAVDDDGAEKSLAVTRFRYPFRRVSPYFYET